MGQGRHENKMFYNTSIETGHDNVQYFTQNRVSSVNEILYV